MLKILAHKALFISIVITFAAAPAYAQEEERHSWEAHVGFSYAHIRLDSETAVFAPTSRNFYGVQTGLKLNLHKNIGVMLFDGGFQWAEPKFPPLWVRSTMRTHGSKPFRHCLGRNSPSAVAKSTSSAAPSSDLTIPSLFCSLRIPVLTSLVVLISPWAQVVAWTSSSSTTWLCELERTISPRE